MNYVIFFNTDGRKTYFGVQSNMADDFDNFGYKRIKEVVGLEECRNTVKHLNSSI